MDEREVRALLEDVSVVMRALVSNATVPLLARIDAQQKEIDALKAIPAPKEIDPDWLVGRALHDVTPELIKLRDEINLLNPRVEHIGAMIGDEIAKYVAKTVPGDIAAAIEAAKPEPVDIKALVDDAVSAKVDPELLKMRADLDAINPQIEAIGGAIGEEIAEHVGKALASIPVPLTADETKAMIDEAVADLPPAEKGKDADPVEVAAQIAAEVERAVAALPAPQDGKSVTVEDLLPEIEERVAKAVAAIPMPKDGVDGKDGRDGLDVVKFIRDDRGHLNGILRDGTTVDLGEYVGKDGKDVSLDVVERLIAESVAKIAPPEIERDAYLAEFAPDDVASNVSLAVKMMAALPSLHADARSEAHPINVSVTMPEMKAADTTVNVSLPEQVPPIVTVEPAVVNVSPAHVTIEARRSKEVTTVTGYDKNGRIKSFEKKEVDE